MEARDEAGVGAGSPLESSPDREARIRKRAYHLWEAEGRPEGRDAEFWERARELDAIEGNPGAGQVSASRGEPVDEAALQDNLGEFPDRLADQGDRKAAPMTRSQARVGAKGG